MPFIYLEARKRKHQMEYLSPAASERGPSALLTSLGVRALGSRALLGRKPRDAFLEQVDAAADSRIQLPGAHGQGEEAEWTTFHRLEYSLFYWHTWLTLSIHGLGIERFFKLFEAASPRFRGGI